MSCDDRGREPDTPAAAAQVVGKPHPKKHAKPSIKVQHAPAKAVSNGGIHGVVSKELKSVSKVEQTPPRHQAGTRTVISSPGKPSLGAKPVAVEAAQARDSGKAAALTSTGRTNQGGSDQGSRRDSNPSEKRVSDSRAKQRLSQQQSQVDERLLSALQLKARDNDYYGILRVEPDASEEELSKARRERTRELHPDHFSNDEEQRDM